MTAMKDPRALGQHIHHSFDEDLETLRRKVLRIGGVVEEQLAQALDALTGGDAEKARGVIAADRRVNALEVDIDESCVRIVARRQPVAGDLRFVMAVVKTVTDLERMGDEAVRIARMALRFAEGGGPPRLSARVGCLGLRVRRMLRDALDAFARGDVELAVRVVEEDRRVDREYERLVRGLITFMMEDPGSIPRTLEVQWAARALERIGDRACNVCEYVIYFERGEDVRHASLDEVRGKADGGAGS